MNKYKDIKDCNEHSVEHWCELFQATEGSPMTKDQTEMMLKLLFNENIINADKELAKINSESPAYRLIESRAKCYDFTLNPCVIMMIGELTRCVPGRVVMLLTYIQYVCKQADTWDVDMRFLSIKVIPFGIPSEGDLLTLWDSQKYLSDRGLLNMLDNGAFMRSIRK